MEQDVEVEETIVKEGSALFLSSECKSESMEGSTTPKTATKVSEDSLSNFSTSSPKKVQKPAASKKLSLRADVMNKNLFRALRRECKNIFEEYLKDHNLSLSKARRTFFVNLKKFTQHLLDTTQVDWRTMSNFNSSEFAEYLGIFLNSCLMKKGNEEQDEVTYKHTQVSWILYSYSHKKFFEFLQIDEVKVLVKMILECSGTVGFIRNHSALSSHEEEYKTHINKIL